MVKLKAQSAVEFMTTYAWAFLIITLFISIVVLLVTIKNPQEYTPSSCYISPELLCTQSLFSTNSTASTFAILFINDLGAPIQFNKTSFYVYSPYLNTSYPGNCLPSYLPKRGVATCISKIPHSYSVGVQVNPNFVVRYSVCPPQGICSAYLNTTGVASDITVFSKSVFSNVTLLTNTGSGNIILDGVPYQSNTVLFLINNLKYSIYAQPPPGKSFTSWSVSSGINIGSTSQQSTFIYTTTNGYVEATFS